MNKTKTDQELQLLLAKMLPKEVSVGGNGLVYWNDWSHKKFATVEETEWLHVCWLVEQTLDRSQRHQYMFEELPADEWDQVSATWQQRAMALATVKGLI